MRFYRLLLHLYPSTFSRDYEDELTDVFRERVRNANPLRVLFAAIADIVPNAIAAHWELLVFDLRFAFRSLMRTPGFALTTILVAALGVGANTVAFSLADFVLFRPLPLVRADRLVKIWEKPPDGSRNEMSPADYRDFMAGARSFSGAAAYTHQTANLTQQGEPRRVDLTLATPELLPLLGVQPILGRTFTAADATAANTIVLSYGLWKSQFGGDRSILGRVVRLDGTPHTIIGVMPASFQFPTRNSEGWLPLTFREENYEDRHDTYLEVVARLRDGVSIDQARSEIEVRAKNADRKYPKDDQGFGAWVMDLRGETPRNARMLVLALCGAAICILLLSCANLASLFLARGTHRARELAVRSALGAGRERIVRQLMTESFVVAAAGGIVGIIGAALAVPLFAKLVPSTLPVADYPSIDLRVLAMAAGFILVTGVAFGVLPAMRASRGSDFDALRTGVRSGGGRTQRLRSVLVVIEIVASVVLMISSGLLLRAVINIQNRAPGFRADNVLVVGTALPLPKYEKVATRARFYEQVLSEVRALPGVKSAAYITGLPMQMTGGIWPVGINGQEPIRNGDYDVSLRYATPQFFSTMQIPLLRGRDIADTDDQTHPSVAVVSDAFVKRYWPGQDPIGKQFKVATLVRTIVGVAGDVKTRGLERQSEPQIYLPYRQVKDGDILGYTPKKLVVRTTGATQSLVTPIRNIVQRADPEQPLSDIKTMETILSEDTAARVTQVRLLGALAAVALLIAGIGIHGLLTYNVSRRVPEIGVRRALGAQVSGIVALVVREGVVMAVVGVVIGALLAYGAARSMAALLAGIRPADPLTFTLASLLCIATVLAGCARAALRAAHVDPARALRVE
jgi:putative ABC transport system permease protein